MKSGDPSLREKYARATKMFDMMNRLKAVSAGLHPQGLSRSELGALGALMHLGATQREPVTISQLAKEVCHSVPAVSQKVSGLEKKGYARRVMSESDRRVVTVVLTPKGKAVAKKSMHGFMSQIEGALESMGEAKTDELFRLMDELSTALETVAQERDGGNAH